jgi:hypothetical protein
VAGVQVVTSLVVKVCMFFPLMIQYFFLKKFFEKNIENELFFPQNGVRIR